MAGFRLAALVFALTFLVLAAKSNGNPLDAEVRHPAGGPGVRDFQEVDLRREQTQHSGQREPGPGPQKVAQAPAGDSSHEVDFIALYDFTAGANDEVSFKVGDAFNAALIESGWVEGTVLRTGQFGWAPLNYFKEV